jgi:ubiquinol-cytochrome c reductase iron-sulfur subunit
MDTANPGSSSGSRELVHGPGAGAVEPRFPDPGLPAHVHRRSDTDPRAARRAERQITSMFVVSMVGAAAFFAFYLIFPLDSQSNIAWSRLSLGLSLGISLFALGAGAVHWAKTLMPDEEVVEERHAIASTAEEREQAANVIREGGEATGFGRRTMIWGSLTGALAFLAIPAIVPFRDLWRRHPGDPSPADYLRHTMWKTGTRLVTDPEGQPIKPDEVPIGAVVHVLPEGIDKVDDPITAETKSAVLLIRLEPDELVEEPSRRSWSYHGIVAYSKICTHVGCPVPLYEQTTHHLLCPCHQSTFDVTHHCRVVFGPAARPLPQLAIALDSDGYLVAQHDFLEPVGPSFWERNR